jgi:hypothetical protein
MDGHPEIEKLKSEFFSLATKHSTAFCAGDHLAANKIHKQLMKLKIESMQLESTDLFESFLYHEHVGIATWAAVFTLKSKPTLAETRLLELSKEDSILGRSALAVLDLWRKGLLNPL